MTGAGWGRSPRVGGRTRFAVLFKAPVVANPPSKPMYPNTNLFIDGAWTPAQSGRTAPVINPATGEQIGTHAYAE